MENTTHARDRAAARVRSLTAWALAGAGVLTAGFAGLAAGSTHTKKTVSNAAATKKSQATVTAPTPTLQSNGSAAAPVQPQSQSPVSPAVSPPVVVSGGS
jgi:hypothetical protein